jgi:hypothetical protein
MPIGGGFDIHRKQITFDYVDVQTGEVRCGQIAPADRVHLAGWLAERFAGRGDVEFAVEGCTGWRYVAEVVAHVAEPAGTAALRGRKRHAKTDKTRGTCVRRWPMGGCRSAGSRRATSWSAARCWSYRDVRVEHTT